MKENNTNIIRSSSVEYLTFIAATGYGGVNAIYENENVWLSQKMMAELYQVNVRTDCRFGRNAVFFDGVKATRERYATARNWFGLWAFQYGG